MVGSHLKDGGKMTQSNWRFKRPQSHLLYPLETLLHCLIYVQVRLMAVKAIPGSGNGYVSDILYGLYYSLMMGAHITSNSYGGDQKTQSFSQML